MTVAVIFTDEVACRLPRDATLRRVITEPLAAELIQQTRAHPVVVDLLSFRLSRHSWHIKDKNAHYPALLSGALLAWSVGGGVAFWSRNTQRGSIVSTFHLAVILGET